MACLSPLPTPRPPLTPLTSDPAGTHLPVEDVGVVVHVVGQQVGLGAHEQRVAGGGGAQRAGGEAADRLVDVEQGDVRVLRALAQPVRRLPLAARVRVVDEHLDGRTVARALQMKPRKSIKYH